MANPASPSETSPPSYPHRLGGSILRSRSTKTTRKESGASTSAPPITSQSLPSEVLVARYNDIKRVSKALVQYFETIVELENESVKVLSKSSTALNKVLPLESGFQFIPEDNQAPGLQGICKAIRERTREIENSHATLAKSIESSVIEPLKKIRVDIKAHIKSIESEVVNLENEAAKERDASGQAIIDLSRSINTAQTDPKGLNLTNDPFVVNRQTHRQLKKQLRVENELHQATVLTQQRSRAFEQDVISQIQRAWSNFEQWASQTRNTESREWVGLRDLVQGLRPEQEWEHFAAIPNTILDPNAPARDPSAITYPGQDDKSVAVVKKGILKRKKRWTKMESDGLWILTSSGFLHEVPKGDEEEEPTMSLYVPNVVLSPLWSTTTSKDHGFTLEGSKEATGGMERTMKTKMGIGSKEIEYLFMASSHSDAEGWWNALSEYARHVYQSREQAQQAEMLSASKSSGHEFDTEENAEAANVSGSSLEVQRSPSAGSGSPMEPNKEKVEGAEPQATGSGTRSGTTSASAAPQLPSRKTSTKEGTDTLPRLDTSKEISESPAQSADPTTITTRQRSNTAKSARAAEKAPMVSTEELPKSADPALPSSFPQEKKQERAFSSNSSRYIERFDVE